MRCSLTVVALAVALVCVGPPAPAHAQNDDWAVRRNPLDPRVVGRYQRMLESNPGDRTALRKLTELYTRHASLAKLLEEYARKQRKSPKNFAYAMIIGHLHRHRGAIDQALASYEKAAEIRPKDERVHLARGELYQRLGKHVLAMSAYGQALALAGNGPAKKNILKTLAGLALDKGDINKARVYFASYIELSPGNVAARLELADALSQHQLNKEALVEYRWAEARLKSDAARRVVVLARIGRELETMGKSTEAVTAYRQAMGLTQEGHHIRRELTERIIEIYRKRQDIRSLITYYEKAWPKNKRGHFEWETLARLYESTGMQDQAVGAYQKAVASAPTELDTQRRFIDVLDIMGKSAEVIKRYEALTRIAPGEPNFVLQLAERYFRSGARAKAKNMLARAAQRFPNDPGVHAALADLYTRWGETQLALKAYQRLVRIEPNDAAYLSLLGDQYFQRGNRKMAKETWRRIAAPKTAKAYSRLAEVYAEHDMGADAIGAYRRAILIKPKDADLYRGVARVYERQRDHIPAQEAWRKVIELTKGQANMKSLRREARTRIIASLERDTGQSLNREIRRWRDDFVRDPTNIETGYFLVEGYLKLGKTEEARKTLQSILATHPNDIEAMQQLVAVYRNLARYADAVSLLKALATLQPDQERAYFTQIAELELALYNDDQAIAYVQKALEKSPTDPDAQLRLAEIYEKKEDFTKAVQSYRRTIELKPRAFDVYFQLAKLYLRRGQRQDAARLYRDVLRLAREESILRKTAEKAINLEEYLGSLDELEKTISPLVFLHSNKPIYRRILVDIYQRYVPSLVVRARNNDDAANETLVRLGEHGLKPLLEALADSSDGEQQKAAARLLGHVKNRNASAPLVKLAQQSRTDPVHYRPGARSSDIGIEVRVEAVLAAGYLADPGVLPDLIVIAKHDEPALRAAAVWAIGRTKSARGLATLVAALDDGNASVQTMACVGLGRIGHDKGLAAAALVLRDRRRHEYTRAACAFALGLAGHKRFADDAMTALTDGNDEVNRVSAWAVGRLGDEKALLHLLGLYFEKKGSVRDAIGAALAQLAQPGKRLPALVEEQVGLVNGSLNHRDIIAQLVVVAERPLLPATILQQHTDAVATSIIRALAGHRDQVLRILRDLDSQPDRISLGFSAPHSKPLASTQAAISKVAKALEPTLVDLCAHPDGDVRLRALRVLAKTDSSEAIAQIVTLLDDESSEVRAAALEAATGFVRRSQDAGTGNLIAAAIAKKLKSSSWQEQIQAIRSLGRLGEHADTGFFVSALRDRSGFVREEAAKALGKRQSALPALLLASRDEVPQVRVTVARALREIGGAHALKRLQEMAAKDPDARVRAAARKPETRK